MPTDFLRITLIVSFRADTEQVQLHTLDLFVTMEACVAKKVGEMVWFLPNNLISSCSCLRLIYVKRQQKIIQAFDLNCTIYYIVCIDKRKHLRKSLEFCQNAFGAQIRMRNPASAGLRLTIIL